MINAAQKKVFEFFKEGPILIPDYQRQYSWGKEEILTLWDDLINAFKNKKKFFLGNIIYTNKIDKETNTPCGREIIDGQQRITTLMLILKDLHKNFETSIKNNRANNNEEDDIAYVSEMKKCLWLTVNRKVPKNMAERKPILNSNVYLSNFEVFTKLLGDQDLTTEEKNSKYYKNYSIIEKKRAETEIWEKSDFCAFILEDVTFATISADDFGEAIDVFSNLNAKGIPLTDIDIFKARIMSTKKTEDDKKDFSEWWNGSLCETISNFYDKNKIDDVLTELFTIYQYHLLALERKEGGKDEKAIIPKLRNYFIDNAAARLEDYKHTNVKDYLEKYLDFQKIFDNTRTRVAEDWKDIKIIDVEIQKLLDILSYHPYKNIKRPVCIYYFLYKDTENFQEKFKKFLKRYIVFVVGSYINRPDTDTLKNEIIPLIINILASDTPYIKDVNMENIVFHISRDVSNKDLIRTLLAIYAYSFDEQRKLLPWPNKFDWQIEHIFPKKWKTLKHEAKLTEDKGFGEKIQDDIELIGNKMPLEQELNNKAKNEYLPGKLKFYEKSVISAVSEMCSLSSEEQEEWYSTNVLYSIKARGEKIAKKIKSKFEEWIDQYSKQ